MTWAPPYNISVTRQRLRGFYGGAGPRNALTHLGLQFWVPAPDGGLARATSGGTITDAIIQDFVAWGHRNGIKVLLCVYNGDGEYWDWDLAKNAFEAHRGKFIGELMAEMQALGLDGIDIDLEGPDQLFPDVYDDKAAYVNFIHQLAARVHMRGKQITLDSFPYIYNGPNQDWWNALFRHVDGLTSMGYQELGRNPPATAEAWQKYSFQKAAAGANSAKLLIGMPSDVSSWQGDVAPAQAQWFLSPAAGRVGIGIWDGQFEAAAWRAAPVWQRLKAVRED